MTPSEQDIPTCRLGLVKSEAPASLSPCSPWTSGLRPPLPSSHERGLQSERTRRPLESDWGPEVNGKSRSELWGKGFATFFFFFYFSSANSFLKHRTGLLTHTEENFLWNVLFLYLNKQKPGIENRQRCWTNKSEWIYKKASPPWPLLKPGHKNASLGAQKNKVLSNSWK